MSPLIDEAISQWSDYLTLWARRVPGAEIADRDGLHIAWANVPVPVYNAALINEPVAGVTDFRSRLSAAAQLGKDKPYAMVVCFCRDALPPDVDDQLTGLLGEAGFVPAIPMTAMAAEDLTPAPDRAVELREAADRASKVDVMRLNCISYGMPVEWAAATVDAGAAPEQGTDFSVIAYVDGAAASTATASIIDGRIYVSLVATDPDHRRKGYAEAAMRRAIDLAREASGLRRVVLHATDAGRPVYERMGFVPTARYLGCFPAGDADHV